MKRLKDNSDVPEARIGILPKTIHAQRGRQGYIPLTRGRMGPPGCGNRKSWRKESLCQIQELVCTWSARKTFVLETMRTANGEVQTREEATVYVKELDLFVTIMLLEETPAVPSLGNLCEDHGYTYHLTSGQKPHLTKNGKITNCTISNCVPFVVPGLSTSLSTTPTLLNHLHHRIPGEESESRNNHRYAVVVQDLETQWLQSFPCKTKTSQAAQKILMKFLEPLGNQKSCTLTIPWNLAKLVKIFPGIIARVHHTDPKQMGLLKEQCAE